MPRKRPNTDTESTRRSGWKSLKGTNLESFTASSGTELNDRRKTGERSVQVVEDPP
ncbi:MAG: hypothetical protein QM736_28445 [Vicinamibacterales bacterium]